MKSSQVLQLTGTPELDSLARSLADGGLVLYLCKFDRSYCYHIMSSKSFTVWPGVLQTVGLFFIFVNLIILSSYHITSSKSLTVWPGVLQTMTLVLHLIVSCYNKIISYHMFFIFYIMLHQDHIISPFCWTVWPGVSQMLPEFIHQHSAVSQSFISNLLFKQPPLEV